MPHIQNLLSRGNGKLGEGIHAWSLPAIDSCPGRSDLCSRVCYARSGRFKTRTMQSRLAENLAAAQATTSSPALPPRSTAGASTPSGSTSLETSSTRTTFTPGPPLPAGAPGQRSMPTAGPGGSR